MKAKAHRNCIIPDYMLEFLAHSDTAGKLRDWAMKTLLMSARIRGQRDALSVSATAIPAGRLYRMIYDVRNQFELRRGEGGREGQGC